MNNQISQSLANQFKVRIMDESLARIKKCASFLSPKEHWKRPNDQLVSMANLVMHLQGNIQQWILTGIDHQKDTRTRGTEFSDESNTDIQVLISALESTMKAAHQSLKKLSDQDLLEKRSIQGFDETVLGIIIHVIEHCSYHTGQITYYTKWIKNIDTAYYEGKDLDMTN